MLEAMHHYYEFDDIRIDITNRCLFRAGEEVKLFPRNFDVLLYLVRRAELLVEKQELETIFWSNTNVEQSVSLLRKALGQGRDAKASGDRFYIQTIPKRGYKFRVKPKEVGRKFSFAILPFATIGFERDEELSFSLGTTDALITKLNNVQQFYVLPISRVLKYSVEQRDPVESGRALEADFVLDGSLQRSGNDLRVTTRFYNLNPDVDLKNWGETFDGLLENIFQLQNAIATKVTEALGVTFTKQEEQRMLKNSTENIEAYILYHKGRLFWGKRTTAGIKKGLQLFKQAIEVDINYTLARIGIADSYILLGSHGTEEMIPKEAMQLAEVEVDEALRADEKLAEAHAAKASLLALYHYNFNASEAEYQRAIKLNPKYESVRHWYATILAATGRFDDALREIREAQTINPQFIMTYAVEGRIYYFAKDFNRAVDACLQTLEMDGTFVLGHIFLGQAYLQLHNYQEAIESFKTAINLEPTENPAYMGELGHAYARAGNKTAAKEMVSALEKLAKQRRYISPFNLAKIYLGLGEKEKAIKQLQKAYEDRSGWMIYLGVDPMFDPLRKNKNFSNLVQQVRFES